MYKLKFSVIITVIFMSVNFVQAQEVPFGVKGGGNLSTIIYGYENVFDTKPGFSYHVGIFAEIPLSEKLSLQPEMLFSNRKVNETIDLSRLQFDALSPTVSNNNNNSYSFARKVLTIPLLLGIEINNKMEFQVGLQSDFLLATRRSGFSLSNVSYEDETIDGNFKFGLGIATGMQYRFSDKWIGQARLYYNISEYFKKDSQLFTGEKFTNNDLVFQLSVGYVLF